VQICALEDALEDRKAALWAAEQQALEITQQQQEVAAVQATSAAAAAAELAALRGELSAARAEGQGLRAEVRAATRRAAEQQRAHAAAEGAAAEGAAAEGARRALGAEQELAAVRLQLLDASAAAAAEEEARRAGAAAAVEEEAAAHSRAAAELAEAQAAGEAARTAQAAAAAAAAETERELRAQVEAAELRAAGAGAGAGAVRSECAQWRGEAERLAALLLQLLPADELDEHRRQLSQREEQEGAHPDDLSAARVEAAAAMVMPQNLCCPVCPLLQAQLDQQHAAAEAGVADAASCAQQWRGEAERLAALLQRTEGALEARRREDEARLADAEAEASAVVQTMQDRLGALKRNLGILTAASVSVAATVTGQLMVGEGQALLS
jgi:hypothetical protein